MTVPRSNSESVGYDCIGYATFVKRMKDPEFAVWFEKLKADIEKMASDPNLKRERLVWIHGRLIDLLDFLDPHCIRVQLENRTRIAQ